MPGRRAIVLLWICFLARGVFYCVALPLWEGFDEYAHFAYVQHIAAGNWLIAPETSANGEVERSIVLAPEEGVTLEVLGDEPAILSADGRPGIELAVGSRVRIRRADHPARLVRHGRSKSFFGLLSDKFSLPGEAPHGPTRRDVGPGR